MQVKKKGGKQKDDVWGCFSTTKLNNKISASCKKCGETFEWAKVERLKKRLHVCNKQTDTPVNQQIPSTHQNDMPFFLHDSENPSLSTEVKTQQKLPALFTKLTNEKDKIDMQVARFVYACNLPFSIVDHPEFVKLTHLLKPSYKPPTAKTIGGSLLDRVYSEISEKSKLTAKSKFATLMQDGWSAIQQSHIISHCINVEATESIYVNAVATKTETKDAKYCAQLAIEAIEIAEEKFECHIGAVITDNCATMLSTRRNIEELRPGIWTYGCNTHYLNLVGKEVVSIDMLKKVKEVQHFFRDKQYPRETLKISDGLQPVLPCETRWNTQFYCLQNFIKNHSKYLDIIKHPKCGVNKEISATLTDLCFYKSVETVMEAMLPIVDAISKVSSLVCHIYDN